MIKYWQYPSRRLVKHGNLGRFCTILIPWMHQSAELLHHYAGMRCVLSKLIPQSSAISKVKLRLYEYFGLSNQSIVTLMWGRYLEKKNLRRWWALMLLLSRIIGFFAELIIWTPVAHLSKICFQYVSRQDLSFFVPSQLLKLARDVFLIPSQSYSWSWLFCQS